MPKSLKNINGLTFNRLNNIVFISLLFLLINKAVQYVYNLSEYELLVHKLKLTDNYSNNIDNVILTSTVRKRKPDEENHGGVVVNMEKRNVRVFLS